MTEFVKGVFLEETKKDFLDIVTQMKKKTGMEGLILGGTELPFILDEKDCIDLKLLNTTQIHVDSILEYALNNNNDGMK
jgi:aspartate racemase